MNFINGNFVGVSFVLNSSPEFIKSSYDRVTIYGSSILDKIWIRNVLDGDYYNNIDKASDYNPEFNKDTVFLAEFNNNLSAGNFSSGGEQLVSWIVTKRKIGTNINIFVGEYGSKILEIYDFLTKNNSEYIYQISPKTASKIGQPILSDTIVAEYNGIFLIDVDAGLSINFNLNSNIGNMSAEDDKTSYKTFNKFNTISIGDKNTLKGNISGVVNSNETYCNGIMQSSDFIETIQDFVNNKSSKILKTKKGDIFNIVTSNFSRSQFLQQSKEQLDIISFDFEQINTVENA